MINFASFATDEQKELNGVKIPLGPQSSITVARLNNKKFQEARKEKMLPYEALERIGKVPDDISDRIFKECVAETVLLGWEGFTDTENGSVVPYSVENAVKVFNEQKEFFYLVLQYAADAELFRPDKKQTEKN